MATKFPGPSLVKVKTKFQVTLPTSVRRRARVRVGDLLEAKVEGGKISLTPVSIVDRELALALEDVRQGRTKGPFKSARGAIRSLHRAIQKDSSDSGG
ncbi:MAG: AbrB/MazE/SpoVT family DNA-binding domain-containing protein [Acidobacteriia bacterium]|nr:AbrB/MazE/SpoVT family DNA-binding domain-containing protein [Terriglobia bacterium]